jgi:hypothetical protein
MVAIAMAQSKRYRHRLYVLLALVLAAAVGGFWMARISTRVTSELSNSPLSGLQFSQDDDDSDSQEVAPAQVEKYVKVYQAMQRDRTLTVEQATAQQHLSVQEFRDIEGKIERDGVLRERVRRELLKTAEEKSNALKLKPQSAPSSSAAHE